MKDNQQQLADQITATEFSIMLKYLILDFPEIKPHLDKINAALTQMANENKAFSSLTKNQLITYTQALQLYSDANKTQSQYQNDLEKIQQDLIQQETLLFKLEKEMLAIERANAKKNLPSNA